MTGAGNIVARIARSGRSTVSAGGIRTSIWEVSNGVEGISIGAVDCGSWGERLAGWTGYSGGGGTEIREFKDVGGRLGGLLNML